jgi:hypothetical protein
VNRDGHGIADLDLILDSLPAEERGLFHRLFRVSVVIGELNPPREMHAWIEGQFGSVAAVRSQKIVKVTNRVTFEEALFNRLRASRPLEYSHRLAVESRVIDAHLIGDPLDTPEVSTPADVFGRVKGKYSITASNIAKYDGFHSIIIFPDHNPLNFTRERIIDYLDTGWKWAQRAHKQDPSAKYYLFLWNCLRRAGASLAHGHAQVTLSRDSHYAKIEALRQGALNYQKQYGSSYFEDLYRLHDVLGLGLEREGVRVMAYLTPTKEKEIMVVGKAFDLSLEERVYEVLACYRDRLFVTNFNLVLVTPPLGDVEEDWSGFPVVVRVVDRGDPTSTSCDIGTMELYAASVVSSDPFQVAQIVKESLLDGVVVQET